MTLARIDGHLGSLMEQAELLARSSLVPKAFRGKPADVVVAMMLGQELGLGPMATMSMVDVIEGNATLNAEGKVSLVRKAGHSISGKASATEATAYGKRRDNGDEMTSTWTMQMASRAGLANKQVWKQYPEAMLWSRAVSQLCRMLFPDVLAGLSYTPEEVESFTGPNAVTDRELSDAYLLEARDRMLGLPAADAETGEIVTRRRPPPNAPLVPDDDVADLRRRIDNLPDAAVADLKADWKGAGLSPLSKLLASDLDDASDLVAVYEANSSPTSVPTAPPAADKGGHDPLPDVGSSPGSAPTGDTGGDAGPGRVPSPSGSPPKSRNKRTTALMATATARFPERAARIKWASALVDRPLGTFGDLTAAEESVLLDALGREAVGA